MLAKAKRAPAGRIPAVRPATLAAVGALGALAILACASASARPLAHYRYVLREWSHSSVELVPVLDGGAAGWCLVTRTEESTGCSGGSTSAGPIIAETCWDSRGINAKGVLTASNVAAVSLEGGPAIPTHRYPTLPDGLRAVVVELLVRPGTSRHGLPHCPPLTPLNARGRRITRSGRHGAPLFVRLRSWRRWNAYPHPETEQCVVFHGGRPIGKCHVPKHPPPGPCSLTLAHPVAGAVAERGDVLTRIEARGGLLGRAYLSCTSVRYGTPEPGARIPEAPEGPKREAAVLLDAAHPGATPPPLPAMAELNGYAGVFLARGWNGPIVARRIPGAWVVVEGSKEEEAPITSAVRLLEALQARVNLPAAARH
jgi:hypothetical protein